MPFSFSFYLLKNKRKSIGHFHVHILCILHSTYYILTHTPWGCNHIQLRNLQGINWQQVGSTNLASGSSAAICCRCNVMYILKLLRAPTTYQTQSPYPIPHTPYPSPCSTHLSDMRPFVREKVASALRFFLSAKHLKMLSSCSCQTRCKATPRTPHAPSL